MPETRPWLYGDPPAVDTTRVSTQADKPWLRGDPPVGGGLGPDLRPPPDLTGAPSAAPQSTAVAIRDIDRDILAPPTDRDFRSGVSLLTTGLRAVSRGTSAAPEPEVSAFDRPLAVAALDQFRGAASERLKEVHGTPEQETGRFTDIPLPRLGGELAVGGVVESAKFLGVEAPKLLAGLIDPNQLPEHLRSAGSPRTAAATELWQGTKHLVAKAAIAANEIVSAAFGLDPTEINPDNPLVKATEWLIEGKLTPERYQELVNELIGRPEEALFGAGIAFGGLRGAARGVSRVRGGLRRGKPKLGDIGQDRPLIGQEPTDGKVSLAEMTAKDAGILEKPARTTFGKIPEQETRLTGKPESLGELIKLSEQPEAKVRELTKTEPTPLPDATKPKQPRGALEVTYTGGEGTPKTVRVQRMNFKELPPEAIEQLDQQARFGTKQEQNQINRIRAGKEKVTVEEFIQEGFDISLGIKLHETPAEVMGQRALGARMHDPKYNKAAQAAVDKATEARDLQVKADEKAATEKRAKAEADHTARQKRRAIIDAEAKAKFKTQDVELHVPDKEGKPTSKFVKAPTYRGLAIINQQRQLDAVSGRKFNVTHVQSGKRILQFDSLAEAKLGAKRLGDALDWSVSESQIPKAKFFQVVEALGKDIYADLSELPPLRKAKPKKKPTAPAKEPFEMTREETVVEFLDRNAYKKEGGKWTRFAESLGRRVPASTKEVARLRKEFAAGHRVVVENALSEGKTVPPEVLKDYPDLVKAEKPVAPKVKKKPPEKGGESVTLGFMGVNPDVARALGHTAVDAMRQVSSSTTELAREVKGPPEVRAGVKQAKDAMINHDRWVRRAESTNKLFEKTVNDVVKPTPKEPVTSSKNRQMLMVHAYENKMKGKAWNELTEIERGVVRWAAGEKAKLNRFIEDNKILELMKSEEINHIFHHWINPKSGKPFEAMYGKFSKGLPQAKQRTVPTYEAGIRGGLEPATTNIGKLIGLEWESAMRAHQSRQMFKTLHNIGAKKGIQIELRTGKPPKPIRMVERWDQLTKQGLTEGYERYSHWSLDKAITFQDADGVMHRIKGAVGIRKELYPFVRSYLESPNYGNLSKLNFAAKSLKLGFSMFHVMSLAAQEVANFRTPLKNIPRGLRLRKELSPEVRLLHQEGLELFKGYEDTGYRNTFFEGQEVWGKAGNAVTKPIELMRDFIFNVVQPGIKTSFAFDTFNKILPKYLKGEKITLAEAHAQIESGNVTNPKILQAARDAVQKSDGHFSGEHYKRSLLETNRFMVKLYFSPEARRFWQGLLLSPTWQREHLLVAKNVAKSFMPDKMIKKLGMEEIGPIKSKYRRYMLGAVSIIGATDLMNLHLTQTMDGEALHLWQNPEEKGFAIRAPWNEPDYTVTDKNGKERTIQGGRAYIRPLKSVFEVAEFLVDPIRKFGYKLSPGIAAIGRQLFPSKYQREYRGIPDIPERLGDFLMDVATPISANNAARWFSGKATPQSAILPFFGFPISRVRFRSRQGTIRDAKEFLEAGDKEGAIKGIRLWERHHPLHEKIPTIRELELQIKQTDRRRTNRELKLAIRDKNYDRYQELIKDWNARYPNIPRKGLSRAAFDKATKENK